MSSQVFTYKFVEFKDNISAVRNANLSFFINSKNVAAALAPI